MVRGSGSCLLFWVWREELRQRDRKWAGYEEDVRPRQADRAAEEVRTTQGIGSEGTLY